MAQPSPSAARPDPARWLFPAAALVVMAGCAIGLLGRGLYDAAVGGGPRLAVSSDPPGASVFLNGRLQGPTPLILEGLASGFYALRLEKDGRQPVVRRLELGAVDAEARETLPPLALSQLRVSVEPRGAEVLLDGELVGHTPCLIEGVSAGEYELVVRKTNFEPYMQRIVLKPGEVSAFGDFPLRDRILVMLRRQIEAEPQRVGHHMDLGHYLFVNDRLEEAADVYARALAVAAKPLELPAEWSTEERDLERRLRDEDSRRLEDELRKKQNWQGKNIAAFRNKIELARAQAANDNIDNWTWVRQAAQGLVGDRKYDVAEDLYVRHIAATPNAPELHQAMIELLAVRLQVHNLSGVREIHKTFMERYGRRPELLRQAANRVYNSAQSYRDQERAEVLGLAEQMLRAGLEHGAQNEQRALCNFELGNVLVYQERFEQAVPVFKESVAGTGDPSTRELRNLALAACLVKLKRVPEARLIFEQLAKSPRESVAQMAQKGLQALPAKDAAPKP